MIFYINIAKLDPLTWFGYTFYENFLIKSCETPVYRLGVISLFLNHRGYSLFIFIYRKYNMIMNKKDICIHARTFTVSKWIIYPKQESVIIQLPNIGFTVKMLSSLVQNRLSESDRNSSIFKWNKWIPKKVNLCVWRDSFNRLPSYPNLEKGVSVSRLLTVRFVKLNPNQCITDL